jgi:hypothetical protein
VSKRKKEYYSDDEDDSDYASTGSKLGKPPVQRNTANARERARMRVLSKAFSKLKTTLPWVPADTKLSKLDTLRLASSYIAHLRQIPVDIYVYFSQSSHKYTYLVLSLNIFSNIFFSNQYISVMFIHKLNYVGCFALN